jgi:regulator of replication initiation timing
MQEEEVHNRDQALEAAGREIQDLKRQQAAGGDEAARMQCTIDDLRAKLEESKQQLKGNEQMIRWLNTQVRRTCTSILAEGEGVCNVLEWASLLLGTSTRSGTVVVCAGE